MVFSKEGTVNIIWGAGVDHKSPFIKFQDIQQQRPFQK